MGKRGENVSYLNGDLERRAETGIPLSFILRGAAGNTFAAAVFWRKRGEKRAESPFIRERESKGVAMRGPVPGAMSEAGKTR